MDKIRVSLLRGSTKTQSCFRLRLRGIAFGGVLSLLGLLARFLDLTAFLLFVRNTRVLTIAHIYICACAYNKRGISGAPSRRNIGNRSAQRPVSGQNDCFCRRCLRGFLRGCRDVPEAFSKHSPKRLQAVQKRSCRDVLHKAFSLVNNCLEHLVTPLSPKTSATQAVAVQFSWLAGC